MKIKPLFAWYDIWIGAYWDRKNRTLYLLPIPCFGLVIQFNRPGVVQIVRLNRTTGDLEFHGPDYIDA